MDQEQLAAGDAATPGPQANDFVTEAAAVGTTTAVAGARSEDQRPRQASAGNPGPRSGGVRAGSTTASAAAARVRQHEDAKARDFREFDHFVKMQLQQPPQPQPLLPRPQQPPSRSSLLTRLQQPPSRSSAGSGGGEVAAAPGPASPDLELRL